MSEHVPEGAGGCVPKCGCHEVAMGWRRDPRYKAGGFFQCTVKNRERGTRNRDYEKSWRYYIEVKRPRVLAAQREKILAQLKELEGA